MTAKGKAIFHGSVGTAGFIVIAAMYWWAADPPNPWVLTVTGAGVLFGIGVTVYRHRAGHFG